MPAKELCRIAHHHLYHLSLLRQNIWNVQLTSQNAKLLATTTNYTKILLKVCQFAKKHIFCADFLRVKTKL